MSFSIALLLLLMVVTYLAPRIFIFIGAGERGVLWKRFGGGVVLDRTFGEGTTLIFPWDIMSVYDTRIQVENGSFDALSSDGLSIQVEASVRYRPNQQHLARLHEEVGPNYLAVVVMPEIAASVRGVIARYRQDELYTSDRLRLQREIVEYTQGQTLERWVRLDDLQIRSVKLPEEVSDAIERKLSAEQRAHEYDFILVSEAKEAERKRTEAQGIRDFQAIVSEGISDEYLRWKGIDATLALAKSPNAKVIVIGAGTDGLPIILNPDAVAASAQGPP
jgi:regulator of protease activity HflC (stomatin/prohibitin superfamily)